MIFLGHLPLSYPAGLEGFPASLTAVHCCWLDGLFGAGATLIWRNWDGEGSRITPLGMQPALKIAGLGRRNAVMTHLARDPGGGFPLFRFH
jgi:hypothetical protein